MICPLRRSSESVKHGGTDDARVIFIVRKGEGNLAAPGNTGAPFIAYQLPLIDERQMKHPSHLYRHKYYAPIVNNDGTTDRAYVALHDNGKRIFNFTGIAVYRV